MVPIEIFNKINNYNSHPLADIMRDSIHGYNEYNEDLFKYDPKAGGANTFYVCLSLIES